MTEIYGFIAVSVIAWAWLALLYWFLASSRADQERRIKNLERHELNRKRKKTVEKERYVGIGRQMFGYSSQLPVGSTDKTSRS